MILSPYGATKMKRVLWIAPCVGMSLCGLVAMRSALATDLVAASQPTSNLVVAPFAVPVAVPVAVVQQPTLFYGVSAYAPPIATSPTAQSPPPLTTSAASPTSPAAAALAKDALPADDALRAQVAALLTHRCAECHRGSQAQGGLMLFDIDGRLLDKLPRLLIVDAATHVDGKAPAMPPGDRPPLTSDEQALVRKWAATPKRLSY